MAVNGDGSGMVLEDLAAGMQVNGVLPRDPVTVVAVTWHGTSALTLTYRDPQGRLAEVLLGRDAEARLATRTAVSPVWWPPRWRCTGSASPRNVGGWMVGE